MLGHNIRRIAQPHFEFFHLSTQHNNLFMLSAAELLWARCLVVTAVNVENETAIQNFKQHSRGKIGWWDTV